MHEANFLILSRMLGINDRARELCWREGVTFVNVWNYFSCDRSYFGKDGLHLNTVEKARLGMVLEEELSGVHTHA